MDNVQSCQLMVEILGSCCYYFIHGDESETHVGVKYIAGLVELIQANLKGLQLEESGEVQDFTAPSQTIVIGCDGSYICKTLSSSTCMVSSKIPNVRIPDLIAVPVSYFERTLEYIENQKQVDYRFNAITTWFKNLSLYVSMYLYKPPIQPEMTIVPVLGRPAI